MSAQPSFQIQPRVIRLRDAPDYLGMDKNRFNNEVRPFVTEFSIGVQGIGFDRLDLDAWLDEYKRGNGSKRVDMKGNEICQNAQSVSRKGAMSGTSRKKLEGTVNF